MIEIAGLIISGVSLLSDLAGRYNDFTSWKHADLLVDREWLGLALSKGHLGGRAEDFRWVNEAKVPTNELKGIYQVVMPYNETTKTKYRVVRGRPGEQQILMKKTSGSP